MNQEMNHLTVIKTTQSSGIAHTRVVYLQNFPDLSSRSKTVAGNITLPLESSTMMYAELQWKSFEWDCTHSMVFEV